MQVHDWHQAAGQGVCNNYTLDKIEDNRCTGENKRIPALGLFFPRNWNRSLQQIAIKHLWWSYI